MDYVNTAVASGSTIVTADISSLPPALGKVSATLTEPSTDGKPHTHLHDVLSYYLLGCVVSYVCWANHL